MHALLVQRAIATARLDGDALRQGLNRDLGFSAEDRSENVRRAAEVARLFNGAGVTVVASFISPRRCDRERVRQIVGESRLIEVFVDAPLAVCEARDPKGLYRRARLGELDAFTGVSSAFETPDRVDLRVDSSVSVDETVALMTWWLMPQLHAACKSGS